MTSSQPAELPEDFVALSAEEQRKILDAGLLMTMMAYRHAAAVIVSPPPSVGGRVKNGSGFVLELGGHHYFGTAWHVVKEWLDRTNDGERVLFQVRNVLLDPSKSLAWKDEQNDIAFLQLSEEEVEQIDISRCDPVRGWPPPHPEEGSYVLISGFPEVIRRQPASEQIEFNALSTMLQVTTVGSRHLVCQFVRENWVSYNPQGIPPPGTELGGMSGGPVFAVGNLAYPLVGLVSEFSADYELLYVKTLSHLPEEF